MGCAASAPAAHEPVKQKDRKESATKYRESDAAKSKTGGGGPSDNKEEEGKPSRQENGPGPEGTQREKETLSVGDDSQMKAQGTVASNDSLEQGAIALEATAPANTSGGDAPAANNLAFDAGNGGDVQNDDVQPKSDGAEPVTACSEVTPVERISPVSPSHPVQDLVSAFEDSEGHKVHSPVHHLPPPLTWECLCRQDSGTSHAVCLTMQGCAAFRKLSEREGEQLIQRDKEDEEKLWKGVEISIARGVLEKVIPSEATRVEVAGRTPGQVVACIMQQMSVAEGVGSVVVLQGQSGTGKGTTTATLLEKLPNSVSWSNGNVFRSLTLLAATHCKNEGIDLKADSEKVLTPENVAQWMSMLRFEKVADRKYDIVIEGLGINARVSEVQNTVLKEPLVAKNIPTVAEQTQGDVIVFTQKALEQMAADGMNVVLEGRAATVQYINTCNRFELAMSDPSVLGERRAAQRLMAAVFERLKEAGGDTGASSEEQITAKVSQVCEEWAQDF